MTTVKFDKSVKYQGVRHAAHEVFKVADEDVEQLKLAGATVLAVEAEDTPDASTESEETSEEEGESGEEETSEEDVSKLKEDLLEYTVPELIKFAEERNIDLQKKTKKAEIYNIIVSAIQ